MSSKRFGFTEQLPLCARLGLRPTSFGWQRTRWPQGVPKRRVFPFFELVFLVKGRHYHESAVTKARLAEAGSVLLQFPGTWHRYGPPDERPAEHYYLIFDGALADRWRAQGILDPARPVLPLTEPGPIHARLRRLWREAGAHAAGRSLLVVRGLVDLVTELALQQGEQRGSSRDILVSRAAQAMEGQHQRLRFQFRAWCSANGAGYERLRKRFRLETGLSPEAYFDQLKLAGVKERLSQGDESILSIARACGFEDPYYFSRWFKKLESIPPRAYRGLLRGEGEGVGERPGSS